MAFAIEEKNGEIISRKYFKLSSEAGEFVKQFLDREDTTAYVLQTKFN